MEPVAFPATALVTMPQSVKATMTVFCLEGIMKMHLHESVCIKIEVNPMDLVVVVLFAEAQQMRCHREGSGRRRDDAILVR
jgi:hypothetical protein